jgi:hypothetical protein
MFNAMSDAEIGRQLVELLPARTVLSMHSAGIGGILGGADGAEGNAGNPGNGKTHGFDLFGLMKPDPSTAAAGADVAGSADTPS